MRQSELLIRFFNINLLSIVIGLLLSSSPITYTPVQAQVVPETLQEKANRIALEVGISTYTLSNLIHSESRWNPTATSTQGDRGIAQINSVSHPEVSDFCAFNPECAMRWTSERIRDGYAYEWVSCNCHAFLKTRIKGLPKMSEINPNSPAKAGAVAISYYNGVKHLSYIKSVSGDVLELLEANFEPCLIAPRTISIDDPHYVGTWAPNGP